MACQKQASKFCAAKFLEQPLLLPTRLLKTHQSPADSLLMQNQKTRQPRRSNCRERSKVSDRSTWINERWNEMIHLCWKTSRGNELVSDSVMNTHQVQILRIDSGQDEVFCLPVCIMPRRPVGIYWVGVISSACWFCVCVFVLWVEERGGGLNHMPDHMGLQGFCSVCLGESKHVWNTQVNTEPRCYCWWQHLINPLYPWRDREGRNGQRLTMYCLAITRMPCYTVWNKNNPTV